LWFVMFREHSTFCVRGPGKMENVRKEEKRKDPRKEEKTHNGIRVTCLAEDSE